jgi:hypothetical protein
MLWTGMIVLTSGALMAAHHLRPAL